MFSSIILAISCSIDSFGIGITYGIKNTKISLIGKIILFFIALFTTYISIFLGKFIQNIIPIFLTKILGSLILITMGFYIGYKALKKTKYSYNIFNNPISSDLDDSKIIDSKEALFLAIALSLDSLCIGIGSSIININIKIFPILVSGFQLLFLYSGNLIGKHIHKLYTLPSNIWSIISSLLLILIGIIKLFA